MRFQSDCVMQDHFADKEFDTIPEGATCIWVIISIYWLGRIMLVLQSVPWSLGNIGLKPRELKLVYHMDSGIVPHRLQSEGNTKSAYYQFHQQDVKCYKSYIEIALILLSTLLVLLSNSRHSQAPLNICNELSDAASAFSGAPESACSYEGGFKILLYLTYSKVKFWHSWDFCASLWETSEAAETYCTGL